MDKRLKKLYKLGITRLSIERSLGLDCGTVKKWEEGILNPEEDALLSMISTFPWILKVADNGYDGETPITLKYISDVDFLKSSINQVKLKKFKAKSND